MRANNSILIITPLIIFIYFLPYKLIAKNSQLDSLLMQITVLENNQEKVDQLIEIAKKSTETDLPAAEKLLNQALIISENLNYLKGSGYSNFYLSKLYTFSEYDLAYELAEESLRIFELINDSLGIGLSLNQLGIIKANNNEIEEAEKKYNKAFHLFSQTRDSFNIARVLNNLGTLAGRFHNDSVALNYFVKAKTINEKDSNYIFLARNLANIGRLYFHKNDFDNALKIYNKAMLISKKVENDNLTQLFILLQISETQIKLKNYNQAKLNCKRGIDLAKESNNKFYMHYALNILTQIYELEDNFKEAYFNLKKEKDALDSIKNVTRIKKMQLLELRHNFEKEKQKQELAHKSEKTKFWLIIISLMVFISIMYILLKNQKLKNLNVLLEKKRLSTNLEKVQLDLELKNRQLTSKVIHLTSKNELINKIIEKLSRSKLNFKKENQSLVSEVINELKLNINYDVWESFELGFNQIHPDFYFKLDLQFPDLTTKEKRLCALLRLNMTSKEISEITQSTIKGVETARVRLRKKLNLTNTEIELSSFLSKY